MEEECIPKRLKGLRIPTYQEVRRDVLRSFRESTPLPKGVRKKGMVKHLLKVDRIYALIEKEVFNQVRKLPPPSEINEFYAEMLRLAGISDYLNTLGKVSGHGKVLRKLWLEYRLRIKGTLNPKEANKEAMEFVGRALSIIRRLSKEINSLSLAVKEIRKLPCISFSNPKVVVAGMPQVGKSTLVAKVSTAKPEVSPFPFTTKEIIVGHARINYLTIQFIDTPGMLDRPFSELNNIERKALTAIRFLADVLLYLIDPRPESYYSLNNQLSLLESIKSFFQKKRLYVLINKVDDVDPDRLAQVKEALSKVYDGPVLKVSALKGVGINDVLNAVKKAILH